MTTETFIITSISHFGRDDMRLNDFIERVKTFDVKYGVYVIRAVGKNGQNKWVHAIDVSDMESTDVEKCHRKIDDAIKSRFSPNK